MYLCYLIFVCLGLVFNVKGQITNETQLLFYGDSQPRPGLGINLGNIDSGMSEWVFTNLFKHAREWRTCFTRNNWLSFSFAGALDTVWSSDGYPIKFNSK